MAKYSNVFSFLSILQACLSRLGGVNGDTLCPDTWVADRGSCYLFALNYRSNFNSAEAFCVSLDSRVVTVDDKIENDFLKSFLRNFQSTPWWIGLTDVVNEGDWLWSSSGEGPTFTDWAPNEPNSYNGQHDEDCGVMHSSTNYQWVDDLCSLRYPPICERDVDDSTAVIG